MNFENIVFVTASGWSKWTDGAVTAMEPWTALVGSSLLVTDFEDAAMVCYRFDGGKPAYALPMIEKRARAEGVIESVAHVAIHQVLGASDGFQTFHTVVGLELWQRLQQWSAQQRDHCLLMPLGALLAEGLGSLQARIVCFERGFHCYIHTAAGLFYASATATSERLEDQRTAVRVLANLCRLELDRGVKAPVQWANLLASGTARDTELREQWDSNAVVPCEAFGAVDDDDRSAPFALGALAALLRTTGTGKAVNPPLQRFAYLGERLLLPCAVVVGVVAAGFFAAGAYWHSEGARQRDANARLSAETVQLEARIAKVNSQQTNPDYVAVATFANKLGDGARFDPLPMLALLRSAASDAVDVKRLRLEGASDGSHSFRVDGVIAARDGLAMGQFVSRLRQAGWITSPLEPADAASGSFSYRLVAAVPAPA